MNVNERKTTGQTRQRGITLVTVALLLLLLGGALMAGVAYLRASLPADLAASQKDALLLADKAVLGFASIHHRLPCPAATPDGPENCALAKGWLPARALDLDATMFAPGLVPMRYVVYSDPSELVAGAAYSHRSLTQTDPLIPPPSLPLDAYEPYGWDSGYEDDGTPKSPTPKDPTTLNATDADLHIGRFSERYDFNARNGLDMCETMRFVRSSFDLPRTVEEAKTYAHYVPTSGITPVMNIAYGIAAPGLGDASDNGSRFEGANASDDQTTPALEAPDRAHGAEYNDYVFVRDLPSLMTAFGCRPVPYHVQPVPVGGYTVSTAHGSGLSGAVATIVNETVELFGGLLDIDTTSADNLTVKYNRQGIITPTPASVQSIAFAARLVEEVESQYEGLGESAAETMKFGITQSVLAAAGIALSTAQIIADTVGIVEAIGAAVACLGLCANEYVAIGFYIASLAVSGVSLVVNIAAMSTLIAGTVKAGQVADRLDVDNVAEMMDAFCLGTKVPEVDVDDGSGTPIEYDVGEAYEYTRQTLEAQRADAESRMNAAKALVDADDTRIKACIDALGAVTANQVTVEGGASTDICTATSDGATSYGATCRFTTYGQGYVNFQTATRKTPPNIYSNLYDAELALQEADKRVADLTVEIAIQTEKIATIDTTMAAYKQTLITAGAVEPALSIAVDKKRTETLTEYQQKYDAAVAERDDLNVARPAKVAAVTVAQTALDTAIASVPNPGAVPNPAYPLCTAPDALKDKALDCASKFQAVCGNAYTVVTATTMCSNATGVNQAYCHLADYEYKKKLYADAVARYTQFTANGPPTSPTCAIAASDGKVIVWSSDGTSGAREVLRRVDKRSLLQ